MRARLRIDTGSETIPLRVGGTGEAVRAEVSPPFMPVYPGAYRGPYEITPTSEAQVMATGGHTMTADLIIDPIPSNYGLITWNGSTLTVS